MKIFIHFIGKSWKDVWWSFRSSRFRRVNEGCNSIFESSNSKIVLILYFPYNLTRLYIFSPYPSLQSNPKIIWTLPCRMSFVAQTTYVYSVFNHVRATVHDNCTGEEITPPIYQSVPLEVKVFLVENTE